MHGASFAFGDSTLSACEGRGIKYKYNTDINNVIIILSFQHGCWVSRILNLVVMKNENVSFNIFITNVSFSYPDQSESFSRGQTND